LVIEGEGSVSLAGSMERTYFETISALAIAVDAKDRYSRGHLDRVAYYCMQIANKMGLDGQSEGVMADEVFKTDPDCILFNGPFLTVDYNKLGVFEEVVND